MKARFQAGSMEGFASQAALMILDLGCFFFFLGGGFKHCLPLPGEMIQFD